MHIPQFLLHPGAAIVFGSVLIDQVGIPIPAIPVLMLAGAEAAEQGAGLHEFASVAVVAALVADAAWYTAGRHFGTRVLGTMCRISLSPDACVRQTESVFARYGLRVLTVAKFIPGVAAVGTAMAGVTRTVVWRFLAYDSCGALLWVAAWLGAGYIFHAAVDDTLETLASFGRVGLAAVAVLVAGYIAFRAWRRYALLRTLQMARIGVEELRKLMDSGQAPVILDVRSAVQQASEGRIPGAVLFEYTTGVLPGIDIARDNEIVTYCSCPNEESAARAARVLQAAGYTRVRPLFGGISAWQAAGYPIETGGTDAQEAVHERNGAAPRTRD